MASDSRRCLIILCNRAGISPSGIGALAAISACCRAAVMSRNAERRGLSCALRAAFISAISRSRIATSLWRQMYADPHPATSSVDPMVRFAYYPPRHRGGTSSRALEQDGLPGCPVAEVAMIANSPKPWDVAPSTGRLVLADGTVIVGRGLGATGSAVGEV